MPSGNLMEILIFRNSLPVEIKPSKILAQPIGVVNRGLLAREVPKSFRPASESDFASRQI
jgi:hypothetical protein